jgi:phosphoribosylanthranilate isomerase
VKIKLCGVKRPEDVAFMNEFQPDYVGFVFAGEKHRVSPETASELAALLDGKIGRVGVFVNEPPESIARTVRLVKLDVVQLHGDEGAACVAALRALLPGVTVWKGVRVRDETSIPAALGLGADLLLLDSFSRSEYGGTGKTADFGLIRRAHLQVPFFLAGGLNETNLRSAVREVSPFGVDLSSGIETGGLKDRRKIERVMRILRGPGKVGN